MYRTNVQKSVVLKFRKHFGVGAEFEDYIRKQFINYVHEYNFLRWYSLSQISDGCCQNKWSLQRFQASHEKDLLNEKME